MTTAPVGTELLDDPAADPAAVALSLSHIARANRWFGGAWAVRWALGQVLDPADAGAAPLTLLDLGTGTGDLPRMGVRWAGRRRVSLVPIGLELHPAAARLAARNGVPAAVASAFHPPVRERGVDIVLVSQVAHHFGSDAVVELLRIAHRLARRAVIIADLRRARSARLAFQAGARLLGFDHVTRHDGLVSIARGYTVTELQQLARRAGVPAVVRRRPGYRLVAYWRTNGDPTR